MTLVVGRTSRVEEPRQNTPPPIARPGHGVARWPWLQIASVAGFILLAAFFLLPRVQIAELIESLQIGGPWLFYLAFALLTLIGMPSTPFFVIGGAAFPLWQNLVGATIGMVLHFTLAHLISSRWLRQTIRRLLEKRGIRPPNVEPGNEWKVALMIKFAPGVPMFLKSYLMGVAGIPLKVFMGVSLPATWIYALAFLTLGKSAMEGSSGWFFGAVALLVFAAAMWRFVKARSRNG